MTDASPDAAQDSPTGGMGLITVAWILAVLLRARRFIIGVTIAGILLALASALTRKPSFTAEFTFIPQLAQDQGRSGLASLAGQFGINVGGLGGNSPPPQLYADLVETRGILGTVARDSVTARDGHRLPMPAFLMIRGDDAAMVQEQTVRKLRDAVVSTSVAARTTGAVTVRARTGSPAASLEIAQRLLAALHEFNRDTRQSQARQERAFARDRLDGARRMMRIMEDSLERFLQGNRQIGGSAALRFEQERLESEVSLQRELARSLSQQAEEAGIREVRDMPVITVIEPPVLPVMRDPMGRVRTMVLWTFGSFFLAVTLVLARAGWMRQRQVAGSQPEVDQLLGEWRRFRGKPVG